MEQNEFLKDYDLAQARMEIPIDKFKLEEECINNGASYCYWSETLAEVKKQRDILKVTIGEVEAEMSLKYRSGDLPIAYEDMKITDKSVAALVDASEEVKRAKRNFFEAEEAVNKLETIVKTFSQRKGLLDNLVTLYQCGYFIKPEGKKTVNDEFVKELRNRQRRKNHGSKEE